MKINWGRILNAGLIAEILNLLIYKFLVLADPHGTPTPLAISVGVAVMFLSILIAAMWVGRKIESNFILHGFLVGIVAIVYYVLINLPDTISGQSDMNNFIAALIGHPPKLLGGIVGGYIAGKLKAKAV